MSGALESLQVVDCSWGMAGPMASGLLADHGADVIVVSPPGGDPFRLMVPAYSVYRRGTRDVTLDLREEAGREALLRLLEGADVFIESWQPGVAARLGVGYQAVHAINPSLVYCSISGFGQDGPLRDLPGYESLAQAVSGYMGQQVGHREPPIYVGHPIASYGAARIADIVLLAALHRRTLDGIGRHVETSLLDGALATLTIYWLWSQHPVPRITWVNREARIVVGAFQCADDEWVCVHTMAAGAHARLMDLLGLSDRVRPANGPVEVAEPVTPEEGEVLVTELPKVFRTRTRADWIDALTAAEVAITPLLHPGQVFDERQVRHNDLTVEVDDPLLGRVTQVGIPAKLSRTPGAVRGPAPMPGAHTDEVLRSLAGTRKAPPALPAPTPTGPLLAGVRVLDFGSYFAGPYASRLLADLGADVIKLEGYHGDLVRPVVRAYIGAARGKRAIAVDLKQPEGREIAHRLVRWADVTTQNMRPGAAERLAMGYDDLRAVKPSIIYVHAPGWGATGPDAQRQSFAPLMSAMAGLFDEVAGTGNPPEWGPSGNEDYGGALACAPAILMALLHLQATGEGQFVECPQLNGMLDMTSHIVRREDGTVLGSFGLDQAQMGTGPTDRLYRTADGMVCVVALLDRDFLGLAKALDRPDLADDERFATVEARRHDAAALAAALERELAGFTTAEAVARLGACGVGAVATPADLQDDFFLDPANLASGRVAEFHFEGLGATRQIAHTMRVVGAPSADVLPPPHLGEHTDEVLHQIGYSREDIADLRERNIVR